MIATFCGHAVVEDIQNISKWIYSVTEQLILEGVQTFYLGGYGEFDLAVKCVLKKQQKKYTQIKIVYVLAYLNRNVEDNDYSYTIYPPIETVPKHFAILRRNEWMVEQSDTIVAYVTHTWGGAAKTLAYAKRKNKQIIQYAP